MRGLREARSAAVLFTVLCAVSCGSIGFPDRPPSLQGEIVGVGDDVPFGAANRIWVKSAPEDPCGIVFAVAASTEIGEVGTDGSIHRRSAGDLEVGRAVRVWAGAVAESCPGQAEAEAIELLRGSES